MGQSHALPFVMGSESKDELQKLKVVLVLVIAGSTFEIPLGVISQEMGFVPRRGPLGKFK